MTIAGFTFRDQKKAKYILRCTVYVKHETEYNVISFSCSNAVVLTRFPHSIAQLQAVVGVWAGCPGVH